MGPRGRAFDIGGDLFVANYFSLLISNIAAGGGGIVNNAFITGLDAVYIAFDSGWQHVLFQISTIERFESTILAVFKSTQRLAVGSVSIRLVSCLILWIHCSSVIWKISYSRVLYPAPFVTGLLSTYGSGLAFDLAGNLAFNREF